MTEPMIDLTMSLDELTERYGPEDGSDGRFIAATPYAALWLAGNSVLRVFSDGVSVRLSAASRTPGQIEHGPRFVPRKPPLKSEAAAEITRLRAEVERLKIEVEWWARRHALERYRDAGGRYIIRTLPAGDTGEPKP